ncbi:MAG: hypothetical protein R6V35_05680 [Candidatus Nanohaloarchaea archaeon]
MSEDYRHNELRNTLEASTYFESSVEGFEGENDEALKFEDEFVEYNGSIYLQDEISRLVEELEQEIDEFSRDVSVYHLRNAANSNGHLFEIGE